VPGKNGEKRGWIMDLKWAGRKDRPANLGGLPRFFSLWGGRPSRGGLLARVYEAQGRKTSRLRGSADRLQWTGWTRRGGIPGRAANGRGGVAEKSVRRLARTAIKTPNDGRRGSRIADTLGSSLGLIPLLRGTVVPTLIYASSLSGNP
jgi:hypothetical protein